MEIINSTANLVENIVSEIKAKKDRIESVPIQKALLRTGLVILTAATIVTCGCGEFEQRNLSDPIYPNVPRSVTADQIK